MKESGATFLRMTAAVAALLLAGAAAHAQTPRAAAPEGPSRSFDRQGEALMREGQLEEAQAAFGKALAIEPNNGRAILLSAQVRWLAAGAQGSFPAVDFTGTPLESQDFSRIVLAGIKITNAHGPRSDWSMSRLEGVTLTGAQLFEADFSNAHFQRVNLDDSVLDRAIARGADFAGSSLVRARAPGLVAERASFAGVRAVAADFDGANFTGADLASADLRASRFAGANLSGAILTNADLRGADISRANLAGASLKGARVDCATRFPRGFNTDAALLVPLDLCGGTYALDFRGKDLAGVSFRDLDMRGALFARARLAGADFEGAILDGADFEGASGFDASFAPASAHEASFERISGPLNNLGRTDLRNARLAGVEGADLDITIGPAGPRTEGANLRNVRVLLDHRMTSEAAAQGGALGLASLLRARIESGTIECAAAPAVRGRRDEAALAEWSAFAETIDTARRAAAANPGVILAESCRRASQIWLAENCEAGQRAAGVRYACPARR
ncbi:MAG: pentapeptide repeat-containing protein [Beijerinckiaceae bacterium]|nr:pentapeptide repeat-containing protein [Beijerinckiaceae bacterium]